jgi:hypothetical protein
MQRHHLPPLELWQRREERLKHAPDSMPEAGDEAVQDELWIVRSCAGVTLDNERAGIKFESAGRRQYLRIFVGSIL